MPLISELLVVRVVLVFIAYFVSPWWAVAVAVLSADVQNPTDAIALLMLSLVFGLVSRMAKPENKYVG